MADGSAGYGITYVLDFKSFDAHSSSISNPGQCSNRMAASFENAPFNEYWTYSECPSNAGQIGQKGQVLTP